MTMAEIRRSGKDILTPADVAEVFGSHPQTIRITAREHPERIGYPFTFAGTAMKIPRIGFINWFDHQNREG